MNTSPIFSIFTLYYLKELKIKLLDSNVSCYNNLYIKKNIYPLMEKSVQRQR